MKKAFFVLSVSLALPLFARAEIFFQDNFDSCLLNCVPASSVAPPIGWKSWYTGGQTATHDGVTHYSNEISAPGRGGTGRSMKQWKHSVDWGGYSGINYYFPETNLKELYMRYYLRIPVALDLSKCYSSNFLKMWRIITTTPNPNHEIYLNANQEGGTTRETARMMVHTYNSGMHYLLSNQELREIWDGNWHALEFHINLATGVLELWVDGALKHSDNTMDYGDGAFKMIQHFTLGNHADYTDPINGCKWQYSWQAIEADDFVLSTTPVGLGNAPIDTTSPIISNPQPSAVLPAGTSQTTMEVTTNEPALCKYAETDVPFESMTSTFFETGSLNHSKTFINLYANYNKTFYVRCMNQVNLISTTSTPVNIRVSSSSGDTIPPAAPSELRAY